MPLLTPDQQTALHNSIDRFFRDNYSFELRRDLSDSELGYASEHWLQFAELGWLAIPFAEEFGGLGGSPADVAHLMRTMGSSLALEPYLASIVLAGQLIARGNNEALKQALLPEIIGGESIACLACNERNSAGNLTYVATRAEWQGDRYRIVGEKTMVLNAPQARYVVVPARLRGKPTDREGIALFLVDRQSPDLSVKSYRTVDGHRAADINLNTTLNRDSLIAEAELGYPLLQQISNEGILLTGCEALGAMAVLLDTTLRYTRERKQFGVELASFQALKHRMADMFITYHSTESLLHEQLARYRRQGTLEADDMSVLKVQVGKAGRLIADSAVQLHGGMGMTDELNVGHYLKRLTALDTLFGNTDFHLKRLARAH